MELENNEESQPKVIPLKDANNSEEKKADNSQELLYVPKYNYLYGKKTLWSQDIELDTILNQYKRIHILDKNSLKRAKWSSEEDKIFTPAPITSIPKNIDINTFENLLRKKKLAEIEKKISTGNFVDEEVDNDKDLRTPSPEPIYDPKSGQRLNTRELRNKEKFLKQKNLLITELIQYDDEYKPPQGYKPPKKTHKIYIPNNEKFYFTRYILGPKGENLKKIQNNSNCKIFIRGEGGGWASNNNHSLNKPKEALHLLIEADNDENLQKGINLILPYLNENSQEYKAAKMALITQINVNNNEWSCEICGEKGHKSWACPLNINQYKAEVVCQYCGDKGHPSMDCPFIENLRNKSIIEENSNKKKNAGDIQNSILFKGLQNKNNDKKNENNNNKEGNNIFGSYEESLVNNYAKFLAVNANKNKLLQKKYYRNPPSNNPCIKEGESITYDYYAVMQGQANNSINNINDNNSNKNNKEQ